jgi:hypothetical protein
MVKRRTRSPGKRLLLSTIFLICLTALTMGFMVNSFATLTRGFDVVALLVFIFSTFVTLVLMYAIVTIFYNVDKLRGKQKRTLRFLELTGQKEGGPE